MEVAVNMIVATVLMREAVKAKVDRPFTIVLFFCAIGLLASLSMAALGFDVSGGYF
jgi:hypothetical protein